MKGELALRCFLGPCCYPRLSTSFFSCFASKFLLPASPQQIEVRPNLSILVRIPTAFQTLSDSTAFCRHIFESLAESGQCRCPARHRKHRVVDFLGLARCTKCFCKTRTPAPPAATAGTATMTTLAATAPAVYAATALPAATTAATAAAAAAATTTPILLLLLLLLLHPLLSTSASIMSSTPVSGTPEP